jgi:hypothetical protein
MSHTRLSLVFGLVLLAACTAPTSEEKVAEAEDNAECANTGTWAIQIATPVKWNASFVVQGGSGTLKNWIRSTRTQDGLTIRDTAKLCGVEVPDYTSAALFGSEKYGIRFPAAVFEQPTMPTFTMDATLTSKLAGATFTATGAASLVGAALPNAITDAWPSSVAALTPVDADGDSKGGLTAEAATGPGFSFPPVNAMRTARADRMYVALRQVAGATTGTVKTCTRSEGTADISIIANKAAIDSHVMGCRRSDGAECSAAEFKLLDSAAPIYSPTGKAVITMVKVADTATCADIRATSFE